MVSKERPAAWRRNRRMFAACTAVNLRPYRSADLGRFWQRAGQAAGIAPPVIVADIGRYHESMEPAANCPQIPDYVLNYAEQQLRPCAERPNFGFCFWSLPGRNRLTAVAQTG